MSGLQDIGLAICAVQLVLPEILAAAERAARLDAPSNAAVWRFTSVSGITSTT